MQPRPLGRPGRLLGAGGGVGADRPGAGRVARGEGRVIDVGRATASAVPVAARATHTGASHHDEPSLSLLAPHRLVLYCLGVVAILWWTTGRHMRPEGLHTRPTTLLVSGHVAAVDNTAKAKPAADGVLVGTVVGARTASDDDWPLPPCRTPLEPRGRGYCVVGTGRHHKCAIKCVCARSAQPPPMGIEPCAFRLATGRRNAENRAWQAAVTGTLNGREWHGMLTGNKWPPPDVHATTMIGLRRLNNLQALLEDVIRRDIPGDFIECGVWRGGATVLAAAIFAAYGQSASMTGATPWDAGVDTGPRRASGGAHQSFGRRVWLADSFQGIPPVNETEFPHDRSHRGADDIDLLRNNSVAIVEESFRPFGLLNEHDIQWLPGWFNETLPRAQQRFDAFAVVRLDGDIYESTWQGLVYLYDYISDGGYVIVDDFTDWQGCRQAVLDFRLKMKIMDEDSPINPVYHGPGEEVRGVWWTVNKRASLTTAQAGLQGTLTMQTLERIRRQQREATTEAALEGLLSGAAGDLDDLGL